MTQRENRTGQRAWYPVPPLPAVDPHDVDDPAPCRVCGGGVGATEGEYWGPWRTHRECVPLANSPAARRATAARKLAVADLSVTDAGLLDVVVQNFADTADAEPVYPPGSKTRSRLPWRHVDRKRLSRAARTVPAARRKAGLDPSVCAQGACAWCGIGKATGGWHTSPYRWRDGTPAPFCHECFLAWKQNGSHKVGEALVAAFVTRLTGVPPMVDDRLPPVLPYVAASDDRAGTEQRWAYLDAAKTDEVLLPWWGRFGGRFAPPERRAEAVAAYEATEQGRREQEVGTETLRLAQARVRSWGDPRGGVR